MREASRMTSGNLRRSLQKSKSCEGSTMLELAKKQEFNKLTNLLSGPDFRRYLEEYMSCQDDSLNFFLGPSPLHELVQFCAPVELVDLMIRRIIEYTNDDIVPEDILDVNGRCPLHVAVLSGCDHLVIKRLLSGVTHILPAVTKDMFDRTPLHYACARGKRTKHHNMLPGRWTAQDKENTFVTVRTLVRAYPEAVDIKDCNGKTPWDLAVEHKAEPRILCTLEAAALMLRNHHKHELQHCSMTEISSEIFLYNPGSRDVSTIGSSTPSDSSFLLPSYQSQPFINQRCEI